MAVGMSHTFIGDTLDFRDPSAQYSGWKLAQKGSSSPGSVGSEVRPGLKFGCL
jgi:hypothetical protein